MKRQVILIKGSTNNEQEKTLSDNYINSYKTYFKSNCGGAFEEDEIIVLDEPSVNDLKDLLKKSSPDYAISILIGHGADQDEKQLFKINPKEIINAGQLELEAPKQLVIIESCRSIRTDIPTVQITDKIPNYKGGGVIRLAISRTKAKELYNNAISSCDEGLVVCYACGQDEKASNFYFSKEMLEKAKEWNNSSNNVNTVLPVTMLMSSVTAGVAEITQNKKQTQNPEIKGNLDFPIAVSKY